MNHKRTKISVIVALVMGAGLMRLIPNVNGFVPVTAATVFAAAFIGRKGWAVLLPIFSVWITDLVLNNTVYASFFNGFTWLTPGFAFQFSAYALISLMGFQVGQNASASRIGLFSIFSSLIFFLVTNFGVWIGGGFYASNFSGLMECYAMGLPFLERSLVADVLFAQVLFHGFSMAQKRFPALG